MTIKDLRDLLSIPVTEDGYTDDTEVYLFIPDDWPLVHDIEFVPMIAEAGALTNNGKLALIFRQKL